MLLFPETVAAEKNEGQFCSHEVGVLEFPETVRNNVSVTGIKSAVLVTCGLKHKSSLSVYVISFDSSRLRLQLLFLFQSSWWAAEEKVVLQALKLPADLHPLAVSVCI